MSPTTYLIENLNSFYEKFSYLEIKYEFRESINTHIVQIKPEECFKEDKLVILNQIDLEDNFETKYPSENILFITDNKLISIESPILELGASYEECVYETISAPFKINFTFEDVEKYINDTSIDGSFEIPEFSPPPKRKWYENLIKPKDLDSNQGLFFISLSHGKSKKSII